MTRQRDALPSESDADDARNTPSDSARTRPGRNGGRLRSGNPRAERTATKQREAFLARMRQIMNAPATARSIEKVLGNPNHKHFPAIARLAAEYSWGRATQFVDLTTHEEADTEQVREKILAQLQQIHDRQQLARQIESAPQAVRDAIDSPSPEEGS